MNAVAHLSAAKSPGIDRPGTLKTPLAVGMAGKFQWKAAGSASEQRRHIEGLQGGGGPGNTCFLAN
jgi:hypothetical protein